MHIPGRPIAASCQSTCVAGQPLLPAVPGDTQTGGARGVPAVAEAPDLGGAALAPAPRCCRAAAREPIGLYAVLHRCCAWSLVEQAALTALEPYNVLSLLPTCKSLKRTTHAASPSTPYTPSAPLLAPAHHKPIMTLPRAILGRSAVVCTLRQCAMPFRIPLGQARHLHALAATIACVHTGRHGAAIPLPWRIRVSPRARCPAHRSQRPPHTC